MENFNCSNKFILKGNLGKQVILGNTEYMVYPIVLLVSGVHQGAIGGPVYYSADVLEQSASHWNNVPLCINHPTDGNGDYVLVNGQGELISQWSIGIIRNASVVDGKLKAEGWIEIRKVNEIDTTILSNLNSGMQMEVSTGLMAQQDSISGTYSGESYEGVITEIYPDHLALLPGQEGACNWNDGCGVRVNKGKTMGKEIESVFINKLDSIKMIDKLYSYVDSLDTMMPDGSRGTYNYLRAVYDDSFIYKQVSSNGEETLYQATYTVNEDTVEFEFGPRTEVIEKVEYLPLTKTTEVNSMTKCCPEKVVALISNETSPYDETDNKWLGELSEVQLDKVINNIKVEKEEIKPDPDSLQLEEVLVLAAPEVKDVINAGIAEIKTKKDGFVEAILANDKNTFGKEDLDNMEMSVLKSIADLSGKEIIKPNPDVTFKGNATPPIVDGAVVEPYVMPSLGQKEKE